MPNRNVATARKEPESGVVLAFPERANEAHATLGLSFAQQRSIAISAGDLHTAVKREVARLLEEHKGNPLTVAKYGLEKLRDEGQINAQEFTSLSELCDAVFAAQRGKIDNQTAYGKVRGLYDGLLVDNGSSPMALAIASVASAAFAQALETTPTSGAMAASNQNGSIGLVGGIIAGGVIGAGIGGVGGAIIGGVVGGIVGGIAGACTQKN